MIRRLTVALVFSALMSTAVSATDGPKAGETVITEEMLTNLPTARNFAQYAQLQPGLIPNPPAEPDEGVNTFLLATGGIDGSFQPIQEFEVLFGNMWYKEGVDLQVTGDPGRGFADSTLTSDGTNVWGFGGWDNSDRVGISLNIGYKYKIENYISGSLLTLNAEKFTIPGEAPVTRWEHAAGWTEFPCRGVLISGGFSNENRVGFLSDNWVYCVDDNENRWQRIGDLPFPMAGHQAVVQGRTGYFFGTDASSTADRLEVVHCDLDGTDPCQRIDVRGSVPRALYGHRTVNLLDVKSKVVVAGGAQWYGNEISNEALLFKRWADGDYEWLDQRLEWDTGLTKYYVGSLQYQFKRDGSAKASDADLIVTGGVTDLAIPEASTKTYLLTFVTPTVPDEYAVPAIARVQGAGAFFTSNMHISNAGESAIELELVFTPRQGSGGETTTVSHTVPAGIMQSIADPLATLFGFDGVNRVGSLLIRVVTGAPEDLMVQTTVFARLPGGEEYGQFFPALAIVDALQAGAKGYLNTTEDAAANRVNVGVMATAEGTEIRVTPLEKIGTPLAAAQVFTLNTGENTQINNIHQVFGLGTTPNVLVEVEVVSGAALAFASVLDGNQSYTGTSDPTTILPVTEGRTRIVLLEIGSIQGLNEFSGSASITNYSTRHANIDAKFMKRGVPGVTATQTITIPAGAVMGYSDLAGELFGVFGDVGTVVFETQSNRLIGATGREFSIFRDGQGAVNGTAGQLIAGQGEDSRLEAGQDYTFIGLRQAGTGSQRERSHFAVYNPEAGAHDMTVDLYDGATGQHEGTRTWPVDGMTLIQVNNVITAINPDHDDQEKFIVVRSTGRVYMNAFRVNIWGDPVTFNPFEGAVAKAE